MPQLDISTFPTQIFWLVVTFAALFLVMWKVAVPRISSVLESRQRRIEDNLDKAAEFKKDAEVAIESYEKAIAGARANAQSMINETAHGIAAHIAKQEAELADKLQARIAESEASIADAKTAVIADIRDLVQDVASSAVERLVGEAADTSSVDKAIDNALKAYS